MVVEGTKLRLPTFVRSRTFTPSGTTWSWTATGQGLLFTLDGDFIEFPIARSLSSPEVSSLLAQLIDEDYAQALGAGVLIPWDHLYELIRAKPYQSSLALLQLPALSPIVPSLRSTGTLTETSFEIGLSGWQNPNGSPAPLSALCGAMALANDGPYLLAQSVWRLVGLISEFASRSAADRTPENNRKQWGKIRRAALDANSVLDDFLFRSIVLTPDKLDIEFRKADIEGTTSSRSCLGLKALRIAGWNTSTMCKRCRHT